MCVSWICSTSTETILRQLSQTSFPDAPILHLFHAHPYKTARNEACESNTLLFLPNNEQMDQFVIDMLATEHSRDEVLSEIPERALS